MITNVRKRYTINVRVDVNTPVSNVVVKYLRVIIEIEMNCKGHLDYSCQKFVSLAWVMANIGCAMRE